MKKITFIKSTLNNLVKLAGSFSVFLNILLPAIILLDVLFRYLFSISFPWLFELEWHLFGAIFLLGAAQTYLANKHVRVDLFYNRFSQRRKNLIDKTGDLLFLLPFSIVGLIYSSKFAYNSFQILEASPDPGGLPFRFIIKAVLPLMFLLLIIQVISNLLNSRTENEL